MLVKQGDEKALYMLNKLLAAAQRARMTGKNLALEKILSSANKLTEILEKKNIDPDQRADQFIRVQGEIV